MPDPGETVRYQKDGQEYEGTVQRILVESEGLLAVSCDDLEYGDYVVNESDVEVLEQNEAPYELAPEFEHDIGDEISFQSDREDAIHSGTIINQYPGDGMVRIWVEHEDGHIELTRKSRVVEAPAGSEHPESTEEVQTTLF